MKKAAPAVLAVLVLLLAAACGGSGDELTSNETSIAKKIAKALTASPDALLTKKQATCTADAFVADVGEKKLKSAKVVAADDSYPTNGANAERSTSAAYAKALLGCVPEKKLLDAYEKTVRTAFTASSTGVLEAGDVSCFSKKFVADTGVARLLASKVITDSGGFNSTGATMETATAGAYADAFLGCVDYQKVQATEVAKSDSSIDAAALEACLRRTKPESEIRALIVAVQTNAANAQALNTASGKKDAACTKEAKK